MWLEEKYVGPAAGERSFGAGRDLPAEQKAMAENLSSLREAS